jgi:nitrate reductase cytochrome c-type subunit
VSSARHACVSYHVPQVDVTPLLENTFKTVPQGKKKK